MKNVDIGRFFRHVVIVVSIASTGCGATLDSVQDRMDDVCDVVAETADQTAGALRAVQAYCTGPDGVLDMAGCDIPSQVTAGLITVAEGVSKLHDLCFEDVP